MESAQMVNASNGALRTTTIYYFIIHHEGDPKVNQIFKEITDCKFKE